ncbi:MAG: hypothetical protein JWO48_3137, partial [Bryobacterales bacterium]|nr:hypothetical protein [Bryobacterales bacterium]
MRLLPVIPLVAVVLSTSCITDKQYRYLAGTNGLRIVGPDGTHESITKIKLPGVEVAQA